MKKNQSILLLILIISLVVFFIFIVKPKNNTISSQQNYFTLKDASPITKIELIKKNENILIQKNQKYIWMLNNTYIAKQELVNEMLKLISNFEIIAKLSEQDKNKYIKAINKNTIEIKLYKKKKLVNNYFISEIIINNKQQSVVADKSKKNIFLIQSAGFPYSVYLAFNTNVNYLREKTLLHFYPNQIKEIRLVNHEKQNKSFNLKILKNNKFELKKNNNQELETSLNIENIELYLGNFQNINFEEEILNPSLYDSLIKTKPLIRLEILNKTDSLTSIKIYEKPIKGIVNIFGKEITIDPDFCYIIKINNKTIFKTKYTEIEYIIKDIEYFIFNEKRKD